MPSPDRRLTADHVRRYARDRCFASGNDGLIGLEIEWLPVPLDDPTAHVEERQLREALEAVPSLPCGGALTMEPGGQIEIASAPTVGVGAARAAVATDAEVLLDALARAGIALVGATRRPMAAAPTSARGASVPRPSARSRPASARWAVTR